MNHSTLFLDEISQIECFKTVPKSELHELSKAIQLITIEKHVAHYFEHSPEIRYIMPLSGRLLLIHDNINESRPFALQLQTGSMWPVTTLANSKKATGVQAIKKGRLIIISSRDLQQTFRKTTNLRMAIYQSIGLSWQSITAEASRKVNLPLFSQLARLVLDFKYEENGYFVVRLAHWQLALLLNSHRETISMELKKMRVLGLIETGRKKIVLINLELLQKIGDDDGSNHHLI